MSRAPRLVAELEAAVDEGDLEQTAWIVARLAARHPQAQLRSVLENLWEVLQAEADVRADRPAAAVGRETAAGDLLTALQGLPSGYGPRLLDWQVDHLVTRLLRAAWRDHCHQAWQAHEVETLVAPAYDDGRLAALLEDSRDGD